jgi:hypothetical protein
MEISYESQLELQEMFETGQVPAGHFLEHVAWLPLIYGADGPQRVYLNLLLEWTGDDRERDVARFPKADHAHVSNYYIDWSTQATVEPDGLRRPIGTLWDRDEHESRQEKERRGFVRRFNASRSRLGDLKPQSLAHDAQRGQRLIAGVRKDNSTLHPTTGNLTTEVRGAVRQFAVRRACKFLIYDAIRQGRVITYALDDLVLQDVVDKTAFELETQPGRFKVPVCTSELRELFRRWDACWQWVRFFRDLHQVDAPWHPNRGLDAVSGWSGYAAARATKLADRLGSQHPQHNALRQVRTLHEQAHYSEAIEAFHSARPSALGPLPNAVWEL